MGPYGWNIHQVVTSLVHRLLYLPIRLVRSSSTPALLNPDSSTSFSKCRVGYPSQECHERVFELLEAIGRTGSVDAGCGFSLATQVRRQCRLSPCVRLTGSSRVREGFSANQENKNANG